MTIIKLNSDSYFKGRLLLVKYEILAEQPEQTFKEIFKFVSLSFLPVIYTTIQEHITTHVNQPFSTFRKSPERISMWKDYLNTSEILNIQSSCNEIFNRLSYDLIGNK